MSPAINPRTGAEIFPGLEPGTELGWGRLAGGPEPLSLAIDQFKYVVFKNPNWNWRTVNFDTDVALADKIDSGTTNAINPNLKARTMLRISCAGCRNDSSIEAPSNQRLDPSAAARRES